MFQAVQGALPRQGLAVVAMRRELAGQHRQGRVLAKLVVVVEVFIAQRQAEDALAQQRLQPVLDQARIAPVGEALGEPADQPKALVQLSQQQRPGVGGDRAAVEPAHHHFAFNRFKGEKPRVTVCRHQG